MKLLFAPDTSDLPNWGCRVMGAWFKATMVRNGQSASWLAPSLWFMQQHPSLPNLNTMADLHRYAREVQAGRILTDIAAVIQQCDAVLLNGENFIRPGAHKGRMLLFLAYLVKHVFRKPCMLTNHTVELDDPALTAIVREVYPMLDEINFREETSAEACSALVKPGQGKQWKVIPDVAFAVPAAPLSAWSAMGCRDGQFSAWPDTAEGFDPRTPYVTVCASSIYSLPQHQHLDVVPSFVQLCRRLRQEIGPVVLAAPCEVDTKIMRQVQAATGFPLLGINLPVRQAIDIIGNASVHVGGRWHLGIFAATGGTPTVALGANSHKVHSLMRMLGMEHPIFDALRLEGQIEAIVAQARAHIEAGPVLRHRLQDRSRKLGAQVDQNLDWIRAKAGTA
ncbi:MAG: polysaccharide pyruvyl transferase family protein [Holophagaceae bacterium]|nr:polysaccharide pyruvyl transferase family protein [Holophagaceae bacterium]